MPIDGDNPDHISWIFEKSQDRAAEYGIQGVTYRLTQGANKLLLGHGSLDCYYVVGVQKQLWCLMMYM